MKLVQKSPLIFLVACFILGLIIGVYEFLYIGIFVFAVVFISGILLFTRKHQIALSFFFTSSFVSLGIMQMQNVFPSENVQLESAEKHFYVAEIQDQLRKGVVWETNVAQLESVKVNGVWRRMHERVLIICQSSSQLLKKGDKIILLTRLIRIKNENNPGEFNSVYYWKSKGVRYQCFAFLENSYLLHPEELSTAQKILKSVRSYSVDLVKKYIGGEEGDLMNAILLGDKSDLELETKLSFANTGAMHVLAVSGLHVGIIAYLLNAFFKHIFRNRGKVLSVVVLVALLWFYAFLTGFSPSVTRAVFMFSVLIASKLMNRHYDSLNSLALAALLILLWSPIALFDIGFQLSFLAMLGIFTVYKPIEQLFYISNKYLLKLWQGTAIGLAAQVFTVPVSLYYFHQFPNYFMLSNVGVMLLSGVILGIGIALLALGKIPFVSSAIGWLAALSVGALILIIQWVDQIPGAVALGFNPTMYWVLAMYLLTVLVVGYQKQISLFIIALLFLPGLVMLQYNRYQNLVIDELCVFNSNQLSVLVNQSGKQTCFYAGNEVAFEDAKRKVANYQRVYPGKATFVPLNFKRFDLSAKDRKLAIIYHDYHIEVKLKNEILHLIFSQRYYEPESENSVSKISARYLGVLADNKHSLCNGAYQSSIP